MPLAQRLAILLALLLEFGKLGVHQLLILFPLLFAEFLIFLPLLFPLFGVFLLAAQGARRGQRSQGGIGRKGRVRRGLDRLDRLGCGQVLLGFRVVKVRVAEAGKVALLEHLHAHALAAQPLLVLLGQIVPLVFGQLPAGIVDHILADARNAHQVVEGPAGGHDGADQLPAGDQVAGQQRPGEQKLGDQDDDDQHQGDVLVGRGSGDEQAQHVAR